MIGFGRLRQYAPNPKQGRYEPTSREGWVPDIDQTLNSWVPGSLLPGFFKQILGSDSCLSRASLIAIA